MLDEFPISQRWPAKNPDIIQLYSVDTPNGLKVSAMLEETGLPYEKHSLSFSHADQHSPEFLALNPNNKIPAIIDPHGPDGKPLALWESGAILLYLAEKSGRFLPTGRHARYETIQWLMSAPACPPNPHRQFGFFQKFGGADWEDKRALARYQDETGRLLKVLNQRLSDHRYVMGDNYSIADISLWPWVRALSKVYDAKQVLELESYHHVTQWLNLCMERTGSVAVLTP